MITIFKDKDEAAWIPVAKGKNGGSARAFLPINGVHKEYRFGYKAESSVDTYFNALRQVQQAFLTQESKVFLVKNGTKEETQYKARWRHGSAKSAPQLSPSGWVLVPVLELEKLSGNDLGRFLEATGEEFAKLPTERFDPILCESTEQLEREVARLMPDIAKKSPVGQLAPEKMACSTEQYIRDAMVVAYVLEKSKGVCERCDSSAPFIKRNGVPYLEVHHVKTLASGGSDRISNAVAICPNCHRELHYGKQSEDAVEHLYSKVMRLARE